MQLPARPASDAAAALHDALGGIAAAAARGARIAVLPECTYPGYVLLARRIPGGDVAATRALRSISAAAKRHRIAVCIGVAIRAGDGALRNEAVFFDATGAALARHAKLLLWNFDSAWFAPGRDVLPFDTEFGRLGMMICADGRMPEIARSLALRGAWLVLDPTAWVGNGAAYERMHNPQVEYMMRVRARENGIWLAAADKCGSEHSAVHYVGQSMIVAPDGSVVTSAGAAEPAIIVADVPRPAQSSPFTVRLSERERRLLRALPRRRAALSSRRIVRTCRLGVLQGPLRSGRAAAVAALRAQGVDAIVDTASASSAILRALRSVRGLRSAVVPGRDMFAPERARAAAIEGADLIAWTDPPDDEMVEDFARTRALENRVYVLVCARARGRCSSLVADPQGIVIARALTGVASGFTAMLDPGVARDKRVVPGTDAFSARVPHAFALP